MGGRVGRLARAQRASLKQTRVAGWGCWATREGSLSEELGGGAGRCRFHVCGTYPFNQSYSAAFLAGSASGSRMVTNSSAAVGWIPTVASKSCLVAPALIATAIP